MRRHAPLLAAAVCVLCLSSIAGYYTLSGQSLAASAHPPVTINKTVDKMITDDKLYEQIPFGSDERTACSPEDPGPGFSWRGILVRAPSRVILPSRDAPPSAFIIPLCGIYTINLGKAIRHPGLQVLIVTDDATGQTYRGNIVYPEADLLIPPPRSAPLKAEDFDHQAFGGYLNVKIAAHVALPLRPAHYKVKVEWSGYQSNAVSINVVQRP